MKSWQKILFIGIIIVFIIGVLAIIFVPNIVRENSDVYKLDKNESIASVKSVVGKRSITSYSKESSSGEVTLKYEYKSDTAVEDVQKYIDYLLDKEGFHTVEHDIDFDNVPGEAVVGKDSSDDGSIIVLRVKYEKSAFTVTIEKFEGSWT